MFNLSLTMHSQLRYVEAEQLMRRVYEIERRVLGPQHPSTISTMNGLRMVLDNHSMAQYSAGDFDTAFMTLMKAEQLMSVWGEKHLFILAKTLWKLGREDEAHSKYVEGAAWCAAFNPHNTREFHHRDVVEEMLGIDARQRDELVAAYFSDPLPTDATIDFWVARGHWHRHQGAYEKAVADMTKAIELEAKNGRSHVLGRVYAMRGDIYFQFKSRWEDVVRDHDEAQRLGYSETWMYFQRGDAHLHLNHLADALAYAQQAVKRDPNDDWHWTLLVKADRAQKKPQQLAETYAASLSNPTQRSSAWCNLGIANYRTGQHQKAVDCFEKADAMHYRAGRSLPFRAFWSPAVGTPNTASTARSC
jgi:tetratricopeptide (TPR) repeat protein